MLTKQAVNDISNQRKLVKAFSALGDLTRFNIIKRLVDKNDICVSELASKLNVTPAAVSQHFRVLELTGLVQPQRFGHKICYRLQSDDEVVKSVIKFVKKQVKEISND